MQLETLSLPLSVIDKGFNAGIKAAVAGTTALVGAMGLAIKATFDWAGEMDELQDVTGASNKAAAAWNFTLRKSGTETASLSKALTILNKGLVDANGKLDTSGKALKDWGIDALDANGVLKDQEALMGEVAAKYSELGTQQEKVNFLTEVFGKSGADLIDFFDTLAADGGIDAVTKKVEALGLAIDPNKYEQFTRNLEEIKLMGLSLAVGFTEWVMPILEDLAAWVMDVGIPAFNEFKNGLLAAFDAGGVGEALSFIDEQLALWISNIDWAGMGTAFGDGIEGLLTNASGEIDVPASLDALAKGLSDFMVSAVGEENLKAFKEHFVDYVLLQLQILNDQGVIKVKDMMSKFWAEHSDTFNKLNALYSFWGDSTLGTVVATGLAINSALFKALNMLADMAEAKLREIAHVFFNRALGWAQQAAQGFMGGLDAIIGAVSTLVGEINAELKKIVTSFTISIKTVFNGSSTGTASTSNLGGSTTSTQNTTTGQNAPGGGRASGGPVIGGLAYNVAEFFRPEVFTPAVSGRIDPMQPNGLQAVAVANWSDFDYSRLASEMVKAWNNT